MGAKKRLSVIAPILNEEIFLPCYLDSVTKYADQVILADGGSEDNSVFIIRDWIRKTDYPEIILIEYKQKGKPYTAEWDSGESHNRCLDLATGDWIMKLDADEVVADNFKDKMSKLMANEHGDTSYAFRLVSFWGDLRHIRVNHPNDPHWSGIIHRMWNNKALRFPKYHHATLSTAARNVVGVSDVKLFHLHYGVGIKQNDNRRGDVNLYNDQSTPPDWGYLDKIDAGYKAIVEPYSGEYPEAVRKHFLKEA